MHNFPNTFNQSWYKTLTKQIHETKDLSTIHGRGHSVGIGHHIVEEGISQVVAQVGKRALAGGRVLCNKTEESKHSQTPVLEFLNLEGSEVTLGEASGVEDASGVSRGSSRGKRVGCEDGVLVDGARVLVILKTTDLYPVE